MCFDNQFGGSSGYNKQLNSRIGDLIFSIHTLKFWSTVKILNIYQLIVKNIVSSTTLLCLFLFQNMLKRRSTVF